MIGIKILVVFALFAFIECKRGKRDVYRNYDQAIKEDREMMGRNYFMARDPRRRMRYENYFAPLGRGDQLRQPNENYFAPRGRGDQLRQPNKNYFAPRGRGDQLRQPNDNYFLTRDQQEREMLNGRYLASQDQARQFVQRSPLKKRGFNYQACSESCKNEQPSDPVRCCQNICGIATCSK
ncbi:uncharacterized protein LOC130644554 [Hydractinia symbiolongicarpus]|uniref:uncharacterized protein LOC130644554 n=1 Tax=Hydractinia symbiolongicarpus TaxID=13093 RepID=UPI00254B7BAA|nr:uncharacterized protein LOC130644554 [Hydractinia symbiolongicarpus]XP_057306193.1 uncharacterized protein LOC130644554 [Hydractinia symbiolongicarpus]